MIPKKRQHTATFPSKKHPVKQTIVKFNLYCCSLSGSVGRIVTLVPLLVDIFLHSSHIHTFMNELHINPHSGNNLTGVKPELCQGTTCDVAIA